MAAVAWIEAGLACLDLTPDDLPLIRKMDPRKAMIARLVRRHTSMGLEWIAAQLHMGVRSSVTRAEKDLQRKLAKDKALAKHWEKLEMQQISS